MICRDSEPALAVPPVASIAKDSRAIDANASAEMSKRLILGELISTRDTRRIGPNGVESTSVSVGSFRGHCSALRDGGDLLATNSPRNGDCARSY